MTKWTTKTKRTILGRAQEKEIYSKYRKKKKTYLSDKMKHKLWIIFYRKTKYLIFGNGKTTVAFESILSISDNRRTIGVKARAEPHL